MSKTQCYVNMCSWKLLIMNKSKLQASALFDMLMAAFTEPYCFPCKNWSKLTSS